MIPIDSPGVKLICRTSYEMTAATMGSPFDYPLSSRVDENDAIFIMDKVLVPWENLFAYRHLEKANTFSRAGLRPALHAARLHAACRQARLSGGPDAQGGRRDRLERYAACASAGGRGPRVAQYLLGDVRRDGQVTGSMG